MPADYLAVRDSCYKRKRKNGKLSEKDKQNCKRMAAIWYQKKHGKPVQHSDAEDSIISDPIELEILSEQLDFFGSFEEYEKWGNNNE